MTLPYHKDHLGSIRIFVRGSYWLVEAANNSHISCFLDRFLLINTGLGIEDDNSK